MVFHWLKKLLHGGVEVSDGGGGAGVSDIRQGIYHKANATAQGGGKRVNHDVDGVSPKSCDLMRKVCQQDSGSRCRRGGECGSPNDGIVGRPKGFSASRKALNRSPLGAHSGVGNPSGRRLVGVRRGYAVLNVQNTRPSGRTTEGFVGD